MLPSRVTHLSLALELPPEEVGRRLASTMDIVSSLLFSITWGLTGRFVGNIKGRNAAMRVRHSYSNGYTRLMYGRIEPSSSGSRLRVEFRDVRFVVVLMNGVALLLALGGLWHWASSGSPSVLGAPATIVSILLVVEMFGKHLGRRDEEAMRRHLAALFQDVDLTAKPRPR